MWHRFRQANAICLRPGESPRTKPGQCLPQRFVHDTAGDRFRHRLGGLVQRGRPCLARGGAATGPCFNMRRETQRQPKWALTRSMTMGARCCNSNAKPVSTRTMSVAGAGPFSAARSLWLVGHCTLHRLRHRGEFFADNVVPKQNETRLAKPLPPQNRIDRALNEVRERPRPRVFSETVPNVPLYRVSAGAPHENLVVSHFEKSGEVILAGTTIASPSQHRLLQNGGGVLREIATNPGPARCATPPIVISSSPSIIRHTSS